MSVLVTEWLDEVMAEIGGADTNLAEFHIREAIRLFAMESKAIIYRPAGINVVNGTASYAVTAPDADSECAYVWKAWHNGAAIYRRTTGELSILFDNYFTKTGTPQFFTMETHDVIVLVPKPIADVTAGLVVLASSNPTNSAESVDDVYLSGYRNIIRYGALASLMMVSNKPYTNMQQGGAYLNMFMGAIKASFQETSSAYA